MAAENPRPADELPGMKIFEMDDWVAKQHERRVGLRDLAGNVHVIDPPELWPDGLTHAATVGDMETCGHMILGDGYEKWTESGLSTAALMARLEQVFEMPVGESAASSSCSTSTARRSSSTC